MASRKAMGKPESTLKHLAMLEFTDHPFHSLNRVWSRQKENSRLVFVKRAHLYHSGRVYMHALYRRRSALDNQLINDVVELSLSPYTRVRR